MTQKFGRNYRLTIYPVDGGDPIIVTMPFTVQFKVVRDIGSEQNRFDIDIYNLAEASRQRIFQDRFLLDRGPRIVFEAGYDTLYQVYDGWIFQANSSREGCNIVTHVVALSGKGDIAATQTYQTLQSGQTLGDIIKYLIGQFPNLSLGAVGDFPTVMQRPVALNGNTWNLLKQYSGDQVYIDNGKIYALHQNEVLPGITILNDETGLLDTPQRDQGMLFVTTLLETSVTLNQMVSLQSSVEPIYDGKYKVNGLMHEGMISAAVSGHCRSVFKLFTPNLFGPYKQPPFKTVQPA